MTNAEAWFSIALRPWKPEGSLGQTAQDSHLDFHTALELCVHINLGVIFSASERAREATALFTVSTP